jgi:ribosomal protein S18 acetylase RimI-like enzyme
MLAAWVAELDGRVAGHVAISTPQHDDAAVRLWTRCSNEPRDRLAVLGRLFVVPSARGEAFGERLIKAAQREATNRRLRIVLDVMAKDQTAIRLYERLGWRFIGTAEHEFGEGQTIPAYCYVAPTP